MNKKGIQLSINFLVVMILSLVLFGSGMFIFSKIMSEGAKIQQDLDSQTLSQLDALMDDGSLIVFPRERITINRGDAGTLPLGILNELSEGSFHIELSASGSNPSGDFELSDIGVLADYDGIETNEKIHALIIISVPKNAAKGQYAFNVDVNYKKDGTVSWEEYSTKKRFYVVVP